MKAAHGGDIRFVLVEDHQIAVALRLQAHHQVLTDEARSAGQDDPGGWVRVWPVHSDSLLKSGSGILRMINRIQRQNQGV